MAQSRPQPAETDPSSAPGESVNRSGRGWSIAVGILLILAGVFSIAFPFISSIAVTLMVGWLLIFAGVIKVMHAFGARGWRGAIWHGIVGLVFVVGGALLLAAPLAGTLSLTALLASILIVQGVIEIVAALVLRDRANWGWVMASGIVALVAGIVIATQLPESALWVLGLVVGLNLIFSGASYLMDEHNDAAAQPPMAP